MAIHVSHYEEDVVPGRRLGRHIQHDDRSRAYAFRSPRRIAELRTVTHSRTIPIMDQGDLGACTGFATVGTLGTDPFVKTLPNGIMLNESLAIDIYSDATAIDDVPGVYPPEDTGSTGLGVAKAAAARSLVAGYLHALALEDTLGALQSVPVITGLPWYSTWDDTDSEGFVRIRRGASVRGGHEFSLVGVNVEGRYVLAANSWGPRWGMQGYFKITWDDFEKALADYGDVTIFVARADAPKPTPATSPDSALWAAMQEWARLKGLDQSVSAS